MSLCYKSARRLDSEQILSDLNCCPTLNTPMTPNGPILTRTPNPWRWFPWRRFVPLLVPLLAITGWHTWQTLREDSVGAAILLNFATIALLAGSIPPLSMWFLRRRGIDPVAVLAKPPRPTTKSDFVICIGVFLCGCLALGLGLFSIMYGITPRDKLTHLEGTPEAVEVSEQQGNYGARAQFLRFTLCGQRIDYSSGDPRFEQVLAAVSESLPLRATVSTKRETLFPRRGWVPLYELSQGDRVLLMYAETVDHKKEGNVAVLIGGAVVFYLGLWSITRCFRNRKHLMVGDGARPRVTQ